MKKFIVDPRIILFQSLVKSGIKKDLAHLISVEVGGSQAFVDEEYLIECGITDKKERQKYLKCIVKFYFSEIKEG